MVLSGRRGCGRTGSAEVSGRRPPTDGRARKGASGAGRRQWPARLGEPRGGASAGGAGHPEQIDVPPPDEAEAAGHVATVPRSEDRCLDMWSKLLNIVKKTAGRG